MEILASILIAACVVLGFAAVNTFLSNEDKDEWF